MWPIFHTEIPCLVYVCPLRGVRLHDLSYVFTISLNDVYSVAVTLIFVLPREPGFQINADVPLTNASSAFNKTIPTEFSRAPANFSFPGAADLRIDTHSNYLPIHLHKLHADVFDMQTNELVGTGDIASMTFSAKKFTPLSFPLNFSYIATNDSDQTCKSNSMNDLKESLTGPKGTTGTMVAEILPYIRPAKGQVRLVLDHSKYTSRAQLVFLSRFVPTRRGIPDYRSHWHETRSPRRDHG